MSLERNLKRDLTALVFLALVIFLGAALVSYDPADPPSSLVYPQNAEIQNVCGRSGAMASALLFSGFGIGAYFGLISLAVLDVFLLMRREITHPWVRLIGWLFSLVGLTTFAALAFPQFAPPSVSGAGGLLGLTGRTVLEMHFARIGSYIVTLSVLGAGLLLCTDYVLVHFAFWGLHKSSKGIGRGVAQVGAAYAQKLAKRRTDLDDVQFDDSVEPTIRVNRQAASNVFVDVEDEEVAEPAASEAVEADAVEESEEIAAEEIAVRKPVEPKKKKLDRKELIDELDAAAPPKDVDYTLPSLDLLLPGEAFCFEEQEKEVRRRAKVLEKTFGDFGFNVRVVEIQTGPVIAQYEVELEAGLRLSKITSLADDLAIALRVPSVRIVAPIPGKNTVGIEVPNTDRQVVRLRDVMEEASAKTQKMRIPIYLGKDVAGSPLVSDLTTMPHLLIAGRTGTGKSVCLNSIIVSMIMTRRPDEVRMLLIDPKMVELSQYKSLPHLMHPVVTDMRKAEAILGWAVEKMEERYHLLARAGVRHISVYNQLGEEELMERIQPEDDEERKQIPTSMPYIVIVADELADLMMTAAKEVESHIIRLAQKSRAVGIHLVLATQKPTVDVITGLIKSNLPARISFQVASRVDSRVVLDEMGADKLLGNGDMLFLWPGTSTLLRGQGTYLSDDEILRVIGAVATDTPEFVTELVQLKTTAPEGEGKKEFSQRDDLYESAIEVVIREGRGSVSLLQRALGIGYGRAARLVDFMAEDGIVGTYNGSQAREVIVTMEQWEAMRDGGAASAATAPTQMSPAVAPTKPRRNNKIQLAPPKPDPIFDENDELDDAEEEASFDEDDEIEPPKLAKANRKRPSQATTPFGPEDDDWDDDDKSKKDDREFIDDDDGDLEDAYDEEEEDLFDEDAEAEDDEFEDEEEASDADPLIVDESKRRTVKDPKRGKGRGGWKAESA